MTRETPGVVSHKRSLATRALRLAILRVGLVSLSAGVISYYVNSTMIERDVTEQLLLATEQTLQRESLPFREIKDLQRNFLKEFKQTLALPGMKSRLVDDFQQIFYRHEDGSYTQRPLLFEGQPLADGRRFAGMSATYAPDIAPNDDTRARFALSYLLSYKYGSSSQGRLFNFYGVVPEKGFPIYQDADIAKVFSYAGPDALKLETYEFYARGFSSPGNDTLFTRMYWDYSNNAWMTTIATPDAVDTFGKHHILACVDVLLGDLMMRTAKPAMQGAYSTLFIADDEGTLIYHPDAMEQVKSTAGHASIRSLKMAQYYPLIEAVPALVPGHARIIHTPDEIVAVGLIPDTPWALAVHYPRSLMTPAITDNLIIVVVLGLLTLLVEILILRSILQKQVALPLFRLIQATQLLGTSKERLRPEQLPAQSSDEIGELARAFATMADRVQDAHEHLELKVRDSTRQAQHLAVLAIAHERAEKRLQESEQRCRDIFNYSLDPIFLLEVTDTGLRCIEVNPALERAVGVGRAELLGSMVEQMLPPQAVAAAIAKYQRCVEKGAALDEEDEVDLPAGCRTFHTTLIPVRAACGRLQRVVGIARDITERKHAERVIHAREQEFRALVENTPDMIARFDLQCRFQYANPVAQEVLGHSLDFLSGKTTCEVSPGLEAARYLQDRLEAIIRADKATEEELSLDVPIQQGTQVACYQFRLVPERDKHGVLVTILAVGRDVSAMRAAEERLKQSHARLRQLSSHRETAREEERKRIAREIHDELGQQLTALRIGVSLLRLQFGSEQPQLVERVQTLMSRIDEIIQVVRNVATSLRPSALDMGLTSALEWLVSEFSRNTGIRCQLNAVDVRLELDDERATAVFRVIQESLTNVARHAQATQVDLQLQSNAECILIEVKDNGRGFDPERLSKRTLGILGMRERGHMLGGTLTIDSAPGQGVCVRVSIPLRTVSEAL
ncbi:PAS domain-containing protein [Pseudomonas sp. B21-056]|uniref:PAS domain-containing protein n=1 Tax=Pseudomonas sp. B21-056 TaxID=2895495 RepID=UPI00222FB842|nr:PAS domain-containing protein [Pseudomonas sp. B21-056]UZE26092.1 PAS domain-containing protein [Pseudomonas sp. B21-056]